MELLENYAKVSTRRRGLGVFASSFNRITRNELKWDLGQTRVAHHLTEILKHNQILHIDFFAHTKINISLANVVIGDKACFSVDHKRHS